VRTSKKGTVPLVEGLRKEVETLPDVDPAPVRNIALVSVEPCQDPEDLDSPSKTPITALLSSIQRGFLVTPSSPLSPPQAYLPVPSGFPEQLKDQVVSSGLPEDVSPDAPFYRSLEQDFMVASDRYVLEAVDLN
jgi:hypothetical protein